MNTKEDIAECVDLNEETDFPLLPNLLPNRNNQQILTINRVTSLFMSSALVFDGDEKTTSFVNGKMLITYFLLKKVNFSIT